MKTSECRARQATTLLIHIPQQYATHTAGRMAASNSPARPPPCLIITYLVLTEQQAQASQLRLVLVTTPPALDELKDFIDKAHSWSALAPAGSCLGG